MFFSNAHKAELASLSAAYEGRLEAQERLFNAHMETLRDQIRDLRQLIFSPTSATQVPLVALEADAVMSQQEVEIRLTLKEQEALEAIESEASRILSGEY